MDWKKILMFADGVLLTYTFIYAYTVHLSFMLKVGSKIFHLSPVYPITSFGVLGIIFLLVSFKPSLLENTIIAIMVRILSGIAGFIAILFIFIQGFTIASASGILAAAALPGFPFTGGLLIHVIFEHALGGTLGLILAIKPKLLVKIVQKVKG
ncbi:hypothetical protein SJAV_18460 [Sulfurisphaera javensis]|uniref:Uncharacterized protein n=1 Tax=Sulfurisphaera javensis TaxID=2049879 RepID=A0AAT9GSV8_9CREN